MDEETKKWLKYGGLGLAAVWLFTRRPPPRGTPLRIWNTYYKLSSESDFGGAPTSELRDRSGNLIANVSRAFFDDFCMEGSGKLRDGRVVNFGSGSSYGAGCTGRVLDRSMYPWGAGVRVGQEPAARALRPLRSVAVDSRVIPYGASVYIREFDGLQIPYVDGLGGFTHDGCFVAEDTGGAIREAHIDIFAGSNQMWRALERLIPTRSTLTVYVNSGRC